MAEPGNSGVAADLTIITGQPNELVAEIHTRMPVILPFERLLTQIRPVIEINKMRLVSEPVLEAARENLVVGRTQ
jgi:putative SOS response-associated peptidase YedK